MDTIKVSDLSAPTRTADKKFKTSSEPLAPLPPLPSPLLCPRRAFLAALILASKFTQDKCYSNRAWAKLSGLPPREIGRCERALGAALDWRLWVGKTAASSSSAPAPSLAPSRSLVRCQSESNLRTPTKKSAFLVRDESCDSIPTGNGLRRASTLPANAFSRGDQDISHTVPARNNQEPFDYPMTAEMPSLSMIPSDNTQVRESRLIKSYIVTNQFFLIHSVLQMLMPQIQIIHKPNLSTRIPSRLSVPVQVCHTLRPRRIHRPHRETVLYKCHPWTTCLHTTAVR